MTRMPEVIGQNLIMINYIAVVLQYFTRASVRT